MPAGSGCKRARCVGQPAAEQPLRCGMEQAHLSVERFPAARNACSNGGTLPDNNARCGSHTEAASGSAPCAADSKRTTAAVIGCTHLDPQVGSTIAPSAGGRHAGDPALSFEFWQ